MSVARWRARDAHEMPEGDSVLCWDGVNRVMFVGYRSGEQLFIDADQRNPTPYHADQWRPLPAPPKGWEKP